MNLPMLSSKAQLDLVGCSLDILNLFNVDVCGGVVCFLVDCTVDVH